jgi:hypothetical protein
MKELFERWVGERARVPGVLACGLRFPDKSCFTQSWSPEYPVRYLEHAWRCASDAFQVLKINSFPNRHVRWVYEQALLYCARRDDGIYLGMFTAKDPQAFDANEIEGLIAEFRALPNEPP